MLQEVVDVVEPHQLGSTHFLAIGGAGMSGIAQFFARKGLKVSGCDQVESSVTRTLESQGIEVRIGHDPSHLADVDTVVVSTAIRENNPELMAARQRGIQVLHRSAALASIMLGHQGISIAGTHGKTTTSAMTAMFLQAAGLDPSYVIGAPIASTRTSSHVGDGSMLVIEADESDGSFLQYPTDIAVITNVEADHLDNWGTEDHYARGFTKFASADRVKAVVINIDDSGARLISEELIEHGSHVITFGESADADVRLTNIRFDGASHARISYQGDSWDMQLNLPGRYNLSNACAAFATGLVVDADPHKMLEGAASFTGTLRRFQLIATIDQENGDPIRIYDDYAHHPTELQSALGAANEVKGAGRLVVCYQPHLYSRTQQFSTELAQALALADEVIVTDVYAAREDPIPGVTGQLIADELANLMPESAYRYVPDKNQIPTELVGLVRPGDMVMTVGAGDITLVGPLLATMLKHG